MRSLIRSMWLTVAVLHSGCDSPTAPMTPSDPPRVTFVPMAAFPGGGFPYRTDWSPVGSRLLFNGTGGLRVFDAATPGEGSRLVLDSWVTHVSWSPDARWISCRLQTIEENRLGLASLFVLSVDGGTPMPLVRSAVIHHHVWAADGNLYYWDEHGERRLLAPPPEWVREEPSAALTTTYLVPVFDRSQPGRQDASLHAFRADGEPSEWVVRGYGDHTWTLARDVLPDGHRFLLSVSSGYSLVVNSSGTPLVEFPARTAQDGFSAASFSADGAYVAGDHAVDDGHVLLHSSLRLADTAGRWIVPIETPADGIVPRFAASGLLIAYVDPLQHIVHVGTLELQRR